MQAAMQYAMVLGVHQLHRLLSVKAAAQLVASAILSE
jgi:hypothetical protein